MSKLIKQHYNRSTILANDIGAITYYTDIHLVDAVGLGNNTVQRIVYKIHNKIKDV